MSTIPIYTYSCTNCANEIEEYQTLHEDPLKHCTDCNSDSLIKIMSLTARPHVVGDPRDEYQKARQEGKQIARKILAGNQEVIADVHGEAALSPHYKRKAQEVKTLSNNGLVKRAKT